MKIDSFQELQNFAALPPSVREKGDPLLLRIIVDLYVSQPRQRSDAIRTFTEMATRLIEQSSDETLLYVAQRLANYPDAPMSVLNQIVSRAPHAALELLKDCPQIEWRVLERTIRDGDMESACMIAQRSDLNEILTDALAARPEREVARALAGNRLAPLSPASMRLMIARGRDDATLGRRLLARSRLDLGFLPLFLCANSDQRWRLMSLAHRAWPPEPGRSEPSLLEDTPLIRLHLLKGRQACLMSLAEFLAEELHCDAISASRIAHDESGEALILALLTVRAPHAHAFRAVFCARPELTTPLIRFEALSSLFNETPWRIASRCVSAMTGGPLTSLRQQPVADPRLILGRQRSGRLEDGEARLQPSVRHEPDNRRTGEHRVQNGHHR